MPDTVGKNRSRLNGVAGVRQSRSRLTNAINKFGITSDGIIEQGKGTVYMESEAGILVPVIIEDRAGNFHNVVRTDKRDDVITEGNSSAPIYDMVEV